MTVFFTKCACVLMFLAVALGAFGAHALRGKVPDAQLDVFKTGVLYHLVHALGLFAVAWLSSISANPKVTMSGILMMAGITLFSGSLYIIGITGLKWFGMLTPLGGICFLAAWALLLLFT